GRHSGDEALTALRTAIDRDGSDDVRREAVEAIGAMDHPLSVTVLREIVASSVRAEVRRTAVEAMSETGGATLESLRELALTSTDPGVVREAVESMEAYPPREAVRALRQIAWSGSSVAARQAVESLRQFPSPYTLVALDSIARAHPSPDVAVQAVESLGSYREPIIDTYLAVIAARTRGTRVEREARDEIRRRLGARPSGDAETEPESDPDPDF
ncbi:MAG TPA: HEAT repeat domain-containing protein, partial [Longimicrobium sp.]|nr:HEAT repeat domain-containing protein [Longimicrobium sp.]